MTYWLSLASTGADSVVVGHVQDRVDRAFDGGAWLRQRFRSDRTAELRLLAAAVPAPAAGDAGTIGGSRKRVVADVLVPAA